MRIPTVVVLSLLCAIACYGFNSYVGYAGSPVSYGACAYSCHGSANSFTPTADGWPSSYEPDSTYTITLSHVGNTISNFNACVLRQSDNTAAGTLEGGSNTATYTHSGEGTAIHGSVNSQTSYTFTWTAPPAGTGTVVLYGAVHEGSASGPNGVCVYASGESGIEETEQDRIGDFSFAIHHSNPLRGAVKIRLSVNSATHLRVIIHDATGSMVALLLDRQAGPGRREVTWTPDTGSGIYFVIIETSSQREAEKLILIR